MDKTAILFPGQGSQHIGMGKTLYEEYDFVRRIYEEANDVLGYDIKKLSFEGSAAELNNIEDSLPAIFIASVAAFKAYMHEIAVAPHVSAGHSLGEYTALACSGVLSFGDALRIIKIRSILSREASDKADGAMTIINDIDADSVEEACKQVSGSEGIVSLACYNSPSQFAVSGSRKAVMKVEDLLADKNAKITPLLMSPPYHCILLKPVMERLKDNLRNISFGAFKWPVLSNVTAAPFGNKEEIIDNLSLQLTRPVQWSSILNNMREMGINTFIEIGPQSVLSELTRKNLGAVDAFSYTQKTDRKELQERFKKYARIGNSPKKAYIPSVVTKCLAAAVSTKNMNWNNEEYEKGVVIPFREIQKMQTELQEKEIMPNKEQMCKALQMLKSVLDTKKISKEKQMEIFNRIFRDTGTAELLKDFFQDAIVNQ